MTYGREKKTPRQPVVQRKGDASRVHRSKSLRDNEAVRSAVSFYKKATKREDVRGIMEDLANL